MIQIGKNVRDIVLKEEIDIETEYNTDDNIDIYYPICVYRNSPRFKEKMINFENRFRKFAWWEMEDPTIKIINRVVKEFNLSEKDKENIIKNYFN